MFLYCQVNVFPGKVLKVWRSLEISAPPVQGCIECFLQLVSQLYAWWRVKRLHMDGQSFYRDDWLTVTIARVWVQYIEKMIRLWRMMKDDGRNRCGRTSSAAMLKQQDCRWYMSYILYLHIIQGGPIWAILGRESRIGCRNAQKRVGHLRCFEAWRRRIEGNLTPRILKMGGQVVFLLF